MSDDLQTTNPAAGRLPGTVGRRATWVPLRLAHVSRRVRLQDPETGAWSEAWTVIYSSAEAGPADGGDAKAAAG